jgi:hypothetical protein
MPHRTPGVVATSVVTVDTGSAPAAPNRLSPPSGR